jgi:hypothetical protein
VDATEIEDKQTAAQRNERNRKRAMWLSFVVIGRTSSGDSVIVDADSLTDVRTRHSTKIAVDSCQDSAEKSDREKFSLILSTTRLLL